MPIIETYGISVSIEAAIPLPGSSIAPLLPADLVEDGGAAGEGVGMKDGVDVEKGAGDKTPTATATTTATTTETISYTALKESKTDFLWQPSVPPPSPPFPPPSPSCYPTRMAYYGPVHL